VLVSEGSIILVVTWLVKQASFSRLMDDAFAQAFGKPISPFKPTLLAPTVPVVEPKPKTVVMHPPPAPVESATGISMVFSPPAKRVAKKPVVSSRLRLAAPGYVL
jgi:formaldehyde-activating enzyme involved in methanogenesis